MREQLSQTALTTKRMKYVQALHTIPQASQNVSLQFNSEEFPSAWFLKKLMPAEVKGVPRDMLQF